MLDLAAALALSEFTPNPQALGRARGTWYEYLVAVGSAEYEKQYNPKKSLIQLPNQPFDCSTLYVPEIAKYVSDLRIKVEEANGVSLITSNPDFVIVRKMDGFVFPTLGTGGIPQLVGDLTHLHRALIGKCELDDICAYAAAKLSVRSDRRLQIPHEGSLMKALYRHIQTRQWNIDAPGISYYAMLGHYSPKDAAALNTVATHSIVDVGSKPQSAVDSIAKINTGPKLKEFLDIILA